MKKNYQIDYKKGIAQVGDLTRLKAVMERAKRGEQLRIGFIGGSITQGSLSSTPQTCYAYLVYEWWCKTFPKAELTYINAGIGGTTSQFGAARVDDDLLSQNPDFVIVEFSVNDESDAHFMETYEGLVRRIYGAWQKPAVLLVHNVFYHNGANAQLVHGHIGRYYQLPAVSMQSSIYPVIVAGKIANRDITPDDLHPNDNGHALVASVITYFLSGVHEGTLQGEEISGQATEEEKTQMECVKGELPAPLTENAYENSLRYRNQYASGGQGKTKVELEGFVADDTPQKDITDCFKYGWTASNVGDAITFQVEGSCIAVQYRKSVKKPAPIAEVVIDDDSSNAVRLNANFEETWGDKLELTTVLEHGEKKCHKVQIRIVDSQENNAVPFYLVSVIGSHGKV